MTKFRPTGHIMEIRLITEGSSLKNLSANISLNQHFEFMKIKKVFCLIIASVPTYVQIKTVHLATESSVCYRM